MVREINLIKVLPQFIQDYREIKQVTQAENPEFQLAANEVEVFRNNQFILYCDEKGISQYERLLKIVPSPEDNLQSRISRVITRWNDTLPYTWRVLLTKLNSLCGDDYEIHPDFDNYTFTLITHLDLFGQVDELQYLLGYMIPANIAVVSKNELNYQISGKLYSAAGMAFCQMFELSDGFKQNFEILGAMNTAATLVGAVEVTITDNFKEDFIIQGDNNLGATMEVAEIIHI